MLPQQIGNTREGGGGGVGLPQLYRSSNSRQICLQTAHLVKILLGKTWLSSESKVVFRHVIHALDLSCQEASTKWGVDHDANAQLPTSWYHFFLRQPEGWITSWMCGQPQTDRQAHRQTDITSTPGAITCIEAGLSVQTWMASLKNNSHIDPKCLTMLEILKLLNPMGMRKRAIHHCPSVEILCVRASSVTCSVLRDQTGKRL